METKSIRKSINQHIFMNPREIMNAAMFPQAPPTAVKPTSLVGSTGYSRLHKQIQYITIKCTNPPKTSKSCFSSCHVIQCLDCLVVLVAVASPKREPNFENQPHHSTYDLGMFGPKHLTWSCLHHLIVTETSSKKNPKRSNWRNMSPKMLKKGFPSYFQSSER